MYHEYSKVMLQTMYDVIKISFRRGNLAIFLSANVHNWILEIKFEYMRYIILNNKTVNTEQKKKKFT